MSIEATVHRIPKGSNASYCGVVLALLLFTGTLGAQKTRVVPHTVLARSLGNLEGDCIAFSPDGSMILTVTDHKPFSGLKPVARTYDAKSLQPLIPATERDGVPGLCLFTGAGRRVLLDMGRENASAQNVIYLFDARSGKDVVRFPMYSGPQGRIAVSLDGARIAVEVREPQGKPGVRVYGTEKVELINVCPLSVPIESLTLNHDGSQLLWAEEDVWRHVCIFHVWDVQAGKEQFEALQSHYRSGGLGSLAAFSPDGKRIVIAGQDMFAVCDAHAGTILFDLRPERLTTVGTETHSVRFAGGGKYIVAFRTRGVGLWEAASGKVVTGCIDLDPYKLGRLSPDGLMVGYQGGYWDLVKGNLVSVPGIKDQIIEAFSPDGKHIATRPKEGTLEIWELQPEVPSKE